MKSHPWFWGTLAFLIFLAGSATTWALIWGPIHPTGRLVGSFEAQVQGVPVKTEVREYQGRLSDIRTALGNSWKVSGWCDSGEDGARLFAALTGTSGEPPILVDCLSSLVDLKVFKQGGDYRFLGLLQRDDGTVCALQSDVPGQALQTRKHDGTGPLLDLPKEVEDSYESQSGPFRARIWRVSAPIGDDDWLEQWCSRQGIRLSSGSWHGPDRIYWAGENSKAWVIRRSPEAHGSTLSWGSIR